MNRFVQMVGLPQCEKEVRQCLLLPEVKIIRSFVLGPEGTNISQANERWLKRMGLYHKAEIELCSTPEDSLEKTRFITAPNELAMFWTCAVYFRLNELFFRNPDVMSFFVQEIMSLDSMQLATRKELLSNIGNKIPRKWRIASHPSPSPLLSDLDCEIKSVSSNAAAAKLCSQGEVEACITTESAKVLHNLATVHEFGCPEMVFFGGITPSGMLLMSKVVQLSSESL